MTKAPQYEQWIIDSTPCWKCGAGRGNSCVSRHGNPTRCHGVRTAIAIAATDRETYNGGHHQVFGEFRMEGKGAWEHAMAPRVLTIRRPRREWPDANDPDRPIQPGELHYKWKPYKNQVLRSRTKPVLGADGILFWPRECTVTLTLRRPNQDITCVLRYRPNGVGMWTVEDTVDEDGNEVHTTQWENITLYERAKAGEDESGR